MQSIKVEVYHARQLKVISTYEIPYVDTRTLLTQKEYQTGAALVIDHTTYRLSMPPKYSSRPEPKLLLTVVGGGKNI